MSGRKEMSVALKFGGSLLLTRMKTHTNAFDSPANNILKLHPARLNAEELADLRRVDISTAQHQDDLLRGGQFGAVI